MNLKAFFFAILPDTPKTQAGHILHTRYPTEDIHKHLTVKQYVTQRNVFHMKVELCYRCVLDKQFLLLLRDLRWGFLLNQIYYFKGRFLTHTITNNTSFLIVSS